MNNIVLHNHLTKSSNSNLFFEDFLPKYQELINDTQLFRYSFLYAPFSHKNSQKSVYAFLNLHLKQGGENQAHAIIEHCPQLELDFLLPSSPTVQYSYATLNEWIETIADEDDADQIRFLAHRVKKGRLTEEAFPEKVQELFS